MKHKILRQAVHPMLKLIFRKTDDDLCLSIDTAKGDKKLIDIASYCLNKPIHKKLCEELCQKVDKIYNIKENREKINNVINSVDKEEKTLPILNMSLVSQNVFDRESSAFKHNVIPRISLNERVKLIEGEKQFEKMQNVFIRGNGNNGLNTRIFDLIMEIYIIALNKEYDILSVLEEEA